MYWGTIEVRQVSGLLLLSVFRLTSLTANHIVGKEYGNLRGGD
jgi:hypothetical protein